MVTDGNTTDMSSALSAVSLCSKLMNMTNCSEEGEIDIVVLLEENLGVRYRSPTESAILTVVYCVIFLSGFVGNVCTCIVIVKNSYMHTATNYYLFTLAISDVLTLILGLPPELYTVWEAYPWRFGAPYCLLKTFLTEMTSSASILTITAFTVERYVAICHPLRAKAMSSLHRAVKTIVIIWIVSCAAALPFPIHTRVYHYLLHPGTNEPIADSLICNIPKAWIPKMRYVFQLTTFVLFVLPMTLITVLYICIGYALRRSNVVVSRQQSSASSISRPRRSIIKMLVAVVVAFFICWAPFHAQRLLTAYVHEWTATLLEIQSGLFYVSGVLYFISATVNPILYNLMSRKYRESFRQTLCHCCESAESRRKALEQRTRYFTDRSNCYSVALANSQRRERELNSLLPEGAELRRSLSDSANVDAVKTGSWRQRLLANRRQRCNGHGEVNENVQKNGTKQTKPSKGRNGAEVEMMPMIRNVKCDGLRKTTSFDKYKSKRSRILTM